ncbi:hypothetical protein HPP92_018113 [Vanilla planifolia]|uniref:Uncharacterized protein n=1 Tax=Vanilla planifolia TaxID=51239 RepID=A0A835QCW3_VANPL|nr:hypothetical protein HPP92_018113 [Vanilla planifolia]
MLAVIFFVVELESKASTDETVGEPSSTSVQSQEHTEILSDICPHEDAVKELSGFIVTDVDDGMHSVEMQECEIGQECFDIDPISLVENDVDIVVAQVEDVDMGPSYFVQCHGDDDNTLDQTKSGIEFLELIQSQVRNANSEPKSAAISCKKLKEDVTVQQETSAVSDHLLLESSNQYFSYSDIYQAESVVRSDIMQVDTINQDSSNHLNQAETGEASHVVRLNSVHKGSCGPDSGSNVEAVVPSSLSFVAEHLEDGTVLQNSHHLGGVVGDDSCISATSVEVRDLLEAAQGQNGEKSCPNSGAGLVETSEKLQSENKDIDIAESNAPVVNGKGTGLPSCTAKFAPQEGSSTVVHTVVLSDSSSDLSQVRSLSKGVAVDSRVKVIGEDPSEVFEADTKLGSLSEGTQSSI